MANELPLELLQWLYKVLLNEYHDAKKTYQDVCLVLLNYKSIKPRTRVFTDEFGRPNLLLNLYGSLKIANLDIPLDIWFPFNYPASPPFIYILSSERFVIKPTNHVQQDGLFFHPYLYNWTQLQNEELRILSLMKALTDALNIDPPCIMKPTRPSTRQDSGVPQLPPKPSPISPQPSFGSPQASHFPQASPMSPPPASRIPQASPLSPPPPARIPLSQAAPRTIASPPRSPPIYKEFEQLSLMDEEPSQIDAPPKLPPNPTRAEALHNLDISLSNISHNEIEKFINTDVVQFLDKSHSQISHWQNEFLKIEQNQLYTLDKIESNNLILDEKISQVSKLNEDLKQQPEYNIDDLITAPTLQHQQLYQLVTKDKSITDTILMITKLYELEKLQLSQLLKFVRQLARDQFLTRALIKKIVKNLNLQTCSTN